MKKVSWIVIILVLVVVGLSADIFYPVFFTDDSPLWKEILAILLSLNILFLVVATILYVVKNDKKL